MSIHIIPSKWKMVNGKWVKAMKCETWRKIRKWEIGNGKMNREIA